MNFSKFVSLTFIVVGFIVLLGTAGSSDYNEECRAAADCIAEAPISDLNMFLRLLGAASLMIIGAFTLKKDED